MNVKTANSLLFTIAVGLLSVLCNGQSEQANLQLLTNLDQYAETIKGLVEELQWNLGKQGETNQHLLVGDLQVTRDRNQQLVVKLGHRKTQRYYYNIRRNKLRNGGDCDTTCLSLINKIQTTTHGCRSIDQNTMLHTELLFLYGRWGRNALQYSRNHQRITLLYSWFIPCADNCHSYGECAGDMARYRSEQREEGQRNHFIVVYSEVYNKTSACQSNLYQIMGGIPVIHFNQTHNLTNASHFSSQPFLQPFLKFPMFFPLPRNIAKNAVGLSSLGVMADCLNRGRFLDKLLNAQQQFFNFIYYRLRLNEYNPSALYRADIYIYTEWMLRKELFQATNMEIKQILKALLQVYRSQIPGRTLYLCLHYVNNCFEDLDDLPAGLDKSDLGKPQKGLDEFLTSFKGIKFAQLQMGLFNRHLLPIENERIQLQTKFDHNQQFYTINA